MRTLDLLEDARPLVLGTSTSIFDSIECGMLPIDDSDVLQRQGEILLLLARLWRLQLDDDDTVTAHERTRMHVDACRDARMLLDELQSTGFEL